MEQTGGARMPVSLANKHLYLSTQMRWCRRITPRTVHVCITPVVSNDITSHKSVLNLVCLYTLNFETRKEDKTGLGLSQLKSCVTLCYILTGVLLVTLICPYNLALN